MTSPSQPTILREFEQAFEFIRLKLIDDLEEPQRQAFWKAVEMRDKIRSTIGQSQPTSALSRPERNTP